MNCITRSHYAGYLFYINGVALLLSEKPCRNALGVRFMHRFKWSTIDGASPSPSPAHIRIEVESLFPQCYGVAGTPGIHKVASGSSKRLPFKRYIYIYWFYMPVVSSTVMIFLKNPQFFFADFVELKCSWFQFRDRYRRLRRRWWSREAWMPPLYRTGDAVNDKDAPSTHLPVHPSIRIPIINFGRIFLWSTDLLPSHLHRCTPSTRRHAFRWSPSSLGCVDVRCGFLSLVQYPWHNDVPSPLPNIISCFAT